MHHRRLLQCLLLLAGAIALNACRTSATPELFAGLSLAAEGPFAQPPADSAARPVRLSRAAETRRVRRVLRSMSLEQKIGQRFICWVQGTQIGEQAQELIRQNAAGVIVSDGISMGALSRNFTVSDSLALMFRAGLDLVLVHSRYDLVELKLEVLRLLHRGELSVDQIEEGTERVLRLKLRHGLLPTYAARHGLQPLP